MKRYLGISGKDSLSTAIVLKAHHPEEWAETELFTNDVKTELPEKYEWLNKCEAYLEKPIERIEKDLIQVIESESRDESKGIYLPSTKVRFCTKLGKIKPMEKRFKGKEQAILYVGLRYDERDRTGYTPLANLIPQYPLIEHQISLPQVFAILSAVDLLPPSYFWQRLFDRVEELVRQHLPLFNLDLKQVLSPVQIYALFRGRTRDNCYFCFFQRQAEWVWLLETHPNLFEIAIALEERSQGYTWCSDGSLRDHIVARKDEIFEKYAKTKAKQVMGLILKKPIEGDEDVLDVYTGGSCGLFCGK